MKTNHLIQLSILFLCFIVSFLGANAQKNVIGNITNDSNNPLQGVEVTVKSTDLQTTSDANGNYSITLPENNKVLIFKKQGYLIAEITVNQDIINIVMNAEDINLTDLSIEELMNIQVNVASTKATTIFNTPSTVSVIDEKTLRNYGFSTVSDALKTISGISIVRSTYTMNIPTSRGILQDHYANKVLVMINGVSYMNPFSGECGSLSRISIADVERIEILKGPASVIYGTNAYSGAINIVLKNKQESKQISGLVGNKNSLGGGGHYSTLKDDISVFASVNTYSEEGDKRDISILPAGSAKPVTGSYYDFLNYTNYTINLGYKQHTFMFNGFAEDQQKLNTALSFANNHETMRGYLLNYNNKFELKDNIKLLSGAVFDWNLRQFPTAIIKNSDGSTVTTGISKGQGWRANVYAKAIYEITEKLNIEMGANYNFYHTEGYWSFVQATDSSLGNNNMKNRDIYEYSLYGQVGYQLGKLNILAGSRYTKNQNFGNNISSRATMVYALNEKNSVKMIYGQSFRAPSTNEMYFVSPIKNVTGNPDLKPETSSSFELAYLTSFNKFFVQLLGYYAVYDNKIYRKPTPNAILADGNTGIPSTQTYNNGNAFKAKGLEFEMKYNSQYFDFFGSFNYVDGDKGDSITIRNIIYYNFKNVSKYTASAGAALKINKLIFSGVTTYYSDCVGGLDKTIDPQSIVDFNVIYNHNFKEAGFQHTLSCKNLFDRELLYPDYVTRSVNGMPFGTARRLQYTLSINF